MSSSIFESNFENSTLVREIGGKRRTRPIAKRHVTAHSTADDPPPVLLQFAKCGHDSITLSSCLATRRSPLSRVIVSVIFIAYKSLPNADGLPLLLRRRRRSAATVSSASATNSVSPTTSTSSCETIELPISTPRRQISPVTVVFFTGGRSSAGG